MKSLLKILAAMACAASAHADWVTISANRVQVLPNGQLALWSSSSPGFVNGCGSATNPFRVAPQSYGVTTDGLKAMLSVAMAAAAAGKELDVQYYPNDTCKVDSMTMRG